MAAALFAALAFAGFPARASELAPVLGGIAWGETSDALAKHFRDRALRLRPPIEFGDSYVDVALRDETFGGYPFAVYFQMEKTSGRLKRILLERRRSGANSTVFRALVAAFTRDYGPPAQSCALKASPKTGYQGSVERVWHTQNMTVTVVFRDTTLEAAEGCITAGIAPCGVTGHLYALIQPGTVGCA